MSRPRFLADHDLHGGIVKGVKRLEPTIEFIQARDANMHERPDPEVLAFAATHGYIVVTHDVNTMITAGRARLDAGLPFPGLLAVPQNTRPLRLVIENLVLIGIGSEAEEWRDRIQFLMSI